MSIAARNENSPVPVAILVNGPSSSGKSTLCLALQERLTALSGIDSTAVFARVAFDDFLLMMHDTLYPISFVTLQGGDVTRLVSQAPHDGRAGWEYIDESYQKGKNGGAPRVRLSLNEGSRRLLSGIHKSWSGHLELGTSLIIDHFLQDVDWCEELLELLQATDAHILKVGVHCSVTEMERREASRADGGVEGRPLGLARRSDELCHGDHLHYDISVWSDQQTTAEAVNIIVKALEKKNWI